MKVQGVELILGVFIFQDLRAVLVGVLVLLSFFQFLNEKIRHGQASGPLYQYMRRMNI